ncbi:MAG: hypothetical protein ACE5RN_01760 [Nitrosopumilaceae archaeon]
MKTQTIPTKLPSIWDKMMHARFKKVIAFDLLFLGLGITIGAGIGVFLAS